MVVRSTNLVGIGVALNTTEKSIMGVEADRTAVVKSAVLYTPASVTRVVELYVHEGPFDPGSGAIFTTFNVAGPGGIVIPTWFVIRPGETVGARTTSGAAPTVAAIISLHGAYLLGAPE